VLTAVVAGAVAFVASAASTSAPASAPTQLAEQAHARPAAAATAAPDFSPLLAMTSALKTTGHDVSLSTQGSTMTGSVDPADDKASAVAKSSGLEIDEIVANGNVYIKANLGTDLDTQAGISPDVWMQLDPSQVQPDNQLLVQPDGTDPVDMPGIMTGITDLKQTAPQNIEGTIDLTQITGHTLPDPDEVTQAGPAATHVPFTVRADPSGRIAEFQVYADSFDPALSLDVSYSNYGAQSAINAPASSIPAPATLYSLFND